MRRRRAKRDRYIPGDYNVIDDLNGFKLKRSECRMRWDGVLVRAEDWEERHPMDFLRGVKEVNNVRDARPEQPDRFVTNVTADDL